MFRGEAYLRVHRSEEGLDINEVVVAKDGVEIGMLGEVDRAGVAVMHNLVPSIQCNLLRSMTSMWQLSLALSSSMRWLVLVAIMQSLTCTAMTISCLD